MGLHDDLLDLAYQLVRVERRRKADVSQAALRRAVSTAYYAVFHLLISEVCEFMPREVRGRLARSFEHRTMRALCDQFANGKLGESMALFRKPIEPELIAFAKLFAELQDSRHDADYDLRIQFVRLEVLRLIRQTKRTIGEWRAIQNRPNGRIFLALFLVGERLNRRP